MRLISACLLGFRCAWSGDDRYRDPNAVALTKREPLIPVCPEQLGGLPTPRVRKEIQGGTGFNVLDGTCSVVGEDGEDVTRNFIRGAEETLKVARLLGIREFIGKARSPSCGRGRIYDGTFSRTLTRGDGVTIALLRRAGLRILTEEDL